jgi:hypothetical protein
MWCLSPAGCVSAHRAAQPAACSGRNAPACRAASCAASAALPRQARRVTPQLASRRPSQQRAAAAARRAARGSPASAPRADVGGEYIENYDDVDRTLLNYFTYKVWPRSRAAGAFRRARTRGSAFSSVVALADDAR